MPNEIRVRQNFVNGIIEDNPLSGIATTMTSTALSAVPVIGTTQHYPIVLDVDGLGGEPEIAYITAHAANATTATILRGQEGTTARQHIQDITWVHGPTALDLDPAWTSYTPTWTTSGTAPAVGNGVLLGRYSKVGRLVHIRLQLSFGTTTTTGTGSWSFALPFLSSNDFPSIMAGHILDGGVDNKLAVGYVLPNSSLISQVIPEGGNLVDNTTPMTWNSTDALHISGVYESAV